MPPEIILVDNRNHHPRWLKYAGILSGISLTAVLGVGFAHNPDTWIQPGQPNAETDSDANQ